MYNPLDNTKYFVYTILTTKLRIQYSTACRTKSMPLNKVLEWTMIYELILIICATISIGCALVSGLCVLLMIIDFIAPVRKHHMQYIIVIKNQQEEKYDVQN